MTAVRVASDQQIASTVLLWIVTIVIGLVIIALVITGIAGVIRSPGVLLYIPLGAVVIGFVGTAIFGNWQKCALVGAAVGAVFTVFAAFDG